MSEGHQKISEDTPAVRGRHVLALAALATGLGVLVAGTVARGLGGALTLFGWALGLYGLHSFGRLGRARTAAKAPTEAPESGAPAGGSPTSPSPEAAPEPLSDSQRRPS